MITSNVSLKPYNTFGIEAKAKSFAVFQSVDKLREVLDDPACSNQNSILILGGGSNLLFTKHVDGIVLKNEISGIEKIDEDNDHIWLRAGAGENWHQLVLHCIHKGYAGIENLSLIPGCTGASPMQNIGAYGVEIKDVFHSLDAFHISDKAAVTFYKKDCEFGYRESVFKNKYKNDFVITHVTFRLNKKPVFNTAYGAIEQQLEEMGVETLTIKAVSDAVIRIRSSKLPDPAVVGNAGSFFKNPVISSHLYETLKAKYPNLPGYPTEDAAQIKVPAGWLIEKAGWKGYREGDAGVHPRQALVLVNYGNATGAELFSLSSKIKESILQQFDIDLEREVNII